MPTFNFEASGMLADIIPDKRWHYCGWCFRPRISDFDLENHSYALNVLKSLGCRDQDHLITPPFNLYLEAALISYVFPYSDEIVYVKQMDDLDYRTVLSVPSLTWEEGRDRIVKEGDHHILVWTYKSVGHWHDNVLKIVPRHPTLGLTFL